jgi:hypothetical protein
MKDEWEKIGYYAGICQNRQRKTTDNKIARRRAEI